MDKKRKNYNININDMTVAISRKKKVVTTLTFETKPRMFEWLESRLPAMNGAANYRLVLDRPTLKFLQEYGEWKARKKAVHFMA